MTTLSLAALGIDRLTEHQAQVGLEDVEAWADHAAVAVAVNLVEVGVLVPPHTRRRG